MRFWPGVVGLTSIFFKGFSQQTYQLRIEIDANVS